MLIRADALYPLPALFVSFCLVFFRSGADQSNRSRSTVSVNFEFNASFASFQFVSETVAYYPSSGPGSGCDWMAQQVVPNQIKLDVKVQTGILIEFFFLLLLLLLRRLLLLISGR